MGGLILFKNSSSKILEIELEPDAEYLELKKNEIACIRYKQVKENDPSIINYELTENSLIIYKNHDFFVKIFKEGDESNFIGDDI